MHGRMSEERAIGPGRASGNLNQKNFMNHYCKCGGRLVGIGQTAVSFSRKCELCGFIATQRKRQGRATTTVEVRYRNDTMLPRLVTIPFFV